MTCAPFSPVGSLVTPTTVSVRLVTSSQSRAPALLRAAVLCAFLLLVVAPRADGYCTGNCGPTAHGWLALALLAAVLVVVGIIIAIASRPARALTTRRKAVELAAARIAEADPAFGPEQLRAAAGELFRDVYDAWNAADRDRLGQLLGTDLLDEWLRELDELARQGLEKRVIVRPKVTIDYVALDRPGGHRDRSVIVHIVTLLGRSCGTSPEAGQAKVTRTGIEEYWTLVRRDQRWIVTAIEPRKEGRRHLDEPIVTGLSGDLPPVAAS
jgi:hypothetical protein